MNRLTYILMLPLLLCACNSGDTLPGPEQPTSHLRIPISIMTGHGADTRMGDPGIEEKMPPPEHVYLLIWKKSDKTTYDFLFARVDIQENDWTYMQDGGEYDNRYQWINAITIAGLTESSESAGFAKNEVIGRCYAIASNVPIPDDELETMVEGLDDRFVFALDADDRYLETGIKEDTEHSLASLEDNIHKLEVNCSSLKWNTEAFRDLYSSPALQDGRVDVLGIGNGLILYNTEDYAGQKELYGDVRLYHAAAKIDFKWEVPAELQHQIAVQKITTTGLPTKCRIFQPTSNPTGTPNNYYIIGADTETNMLEALKHPINPGNKWMGREYFYALQPADGTIHYSVAFESIDGITSKAPVNASFTPSVVNDIFTGWYRINATVSN